MFKRRGSDHWWTSRRVDGTRRFFSLGTPDSKLAAIAEKELDVRIAKGKITDEPKGAHMRVNDLVAKYIEEHSKPMKKSWMDDVDLSKAVLRHLGRIKLVELKPSHLADYAAKRRKEPSRHGKIGVSNTTIFLELNMVKHALKLAVHPWQLLPDTPFKHFTMPRRNPHRVRFFSEGEIAAIYTLLREPRRRLSWLEPIVTLARDTGLRRSNVVLLTWNNISMKDRMITIPITKTGRPHAVSMTEEVYLMLTRLWEQRSLRKVVEIKGEDDFVFVKDDGQPYCPNHVTKAFAKACGLAGVENARFHDTRHDCASRLAMSGVNQKIIMEFLGHKTLAMSDKYTHLRASEATRIAAEALNRKRTG